MTKRSASSGFVWIIATVISTLLWTNSAVAGPETLSEACSTIVTNPKVKNATNDECECVLGFYQDNMKPDDFRAEIEYFKETDRKKRFKIEWDIALSMPPHKYKAVVDEINDLALEECGTDMRHRRSKNSKKKITGKSTATTPAVASTDQNKLSEQTKKEVITEYKWPDWWPPGTTYSRDFSAFTDEKLFCKELVTVGAKRSMPVPEGEQCTCSAAAFRNHISSPNQQLMYVMLFGNSSDLEIAVKELEKGNNESLRSEMKDVKKLIKKECGWKFP